MFEHDILFKNKIFKEVYYDSRNTSSVRFFKINRCYETSKGIMFKIDRIWIKYYNDGSFNDVDSIFDYEMFECIYSLNDFKEYLEQERCNGYLTVTTQQEYDSAKDTLCCF